ncbi:MAG: helix-hairpin-helix domain-containing protein, partial [bacterium]
GVLIYGLWGQLSPEKATVEIVSGEQRTANSVQQSQIVIDVAGAVEKPGLYTLPAGSRIGDVLVSAGGLSASADREWVAKSVNLAEVIKDGGKIYIPEKSQNNLVVNGREDLAPTKNSKININTASVSELDGLTGIGEARAKLILDNRPYSNTDDLVSKAKIPQSVYDKIKNQISVY